MKVDFESEFDARTATFTTDCTGYFFIVIIIIVITATDHKV